MRDWRKWALVIVTLWIAAATLWALTPMSVTVHTGVNADGTERTATIECDSPLSGNTSPTQELPTLGAGQSLGSEPCARAVTSGRTLYLLDLVVTALVLAVVAATRLRPRREVAAADGASVSV